MWPVNPQITMIETAPMKAQAVPRTAEVFRAAMRKASWTRQKMSPLSGFSPGFRLLALVAMATIASLEQCGLRVLPRNYSRKLKNARRNDDFRLWRSPTTPSRFPGLPCQAGLGSQFRACSWHEEIDPKKTRLRSTSSLRDLASREREPSSQLKALPWSLIASQTKGQNSRPLSNHSASNRNRSASIGSHNLGNPNTCTLVGWSKAETNWSRARIQGLFSSGANKESLGLRSIDLMQLSMDSSNLAEGNSMRIGGAVCQTRLKQSIRSQHHWPSSSQLVTLCNSFTLTR